jgi:hypothetical protein
MLYMFQAVPPPIIRSSTAVYTIYLFCGILYMFQAVLPPIIRSSKTVYIVEHFTEISKLYNIASCWLYLEIYLRCSDPWTPNLKYSLGWRFMLWLFDLLHHLVWQVATDVSEQYPVVPCYRHLPPNGSCHSRCKNCNHLPDCTVLTCKTTMYLSHCCEFGCQNSYTGHFKYFWYYLNVGVGGMRSKFRTYGRKYLI